MVKRPAREKAVEARNAFFISDPPSQIMLLREDYLTISCASEVQLFEARELLLRQMETSSYEKQVTSQQTFVFSSFHEHSVSSSF